MGSASAKVLSRVGWVGLALSVLAGAVNQSEMGAVVRSAGCELCGAVGIIGTLFGWFVTGLVLVVGDAFRHKRAADRRLWALAALLYGLSAAWIADDVLRLRWVPAGVAAYGLVLALVVATGVPTLYTLLLTYRARHP